MIKEKIVINISSDFMECEDCGSDSANGCLITVGNWSFGGKAIAHCYGGYSINELECFIALLKKLSIDYQMEKDQYGDYIFNRNKVLNILRSLGYKVDVNFDIYDSDDYYREFGFDDN